MKNRISSMALIWFIAAWLILAPKIEAARLIGSLQERLPDRLASNLSASCGASVTVQSGDTASKIAARCGVTVSALLRANGLGSKSVLWVGQRLVIPGGSSHSSGSSSLVGCPNPYAVRSGDTLYSIAYRCGTTAANLRRWNGLSSDAVRPGQMLITRGYTAPSTWSKTPSKGVLPSPTPRIEPPIPP
jgi:LysM repeat protein